MFSIADSFRAPITCTSCHLAAMATTRDTQGPPPMWLVVVFVGVAGVLTYRVVSK